MTYVVVTLETQNLPTSKLPVLNMGAVSILGKYRTLNKQENVDEGENKICLKLHSHPYFLLMAFTLLHSNGLRVYLMYDYILYGLDTGGTEYLFIKHMNNKPRMMSLRKKLFRKVMRKYFVK